MTEPTAGIPLRWGSYRVRYILALTLILAGGLLVQAGSVYAGYFITGGIALHIVGWLLLPSKGVRRVIIAVPSALCASAPLFSSLGCVLLAVCLLGWLWARQRPAISYLVLVIPVACGLVLFSIFPQYGNGGIVVTVALATVIGAAWVGRAIAGTKRIFSPIR